MPHDPLDGPETILLGGGRPGTRTILSKSREARDNFNVEVSEQAGKGWAISISFGPDRSTLGNLPESPDGFPVSTRVKRLLENGVQRLFLYSARMRQPSPPTRRREVFAPNGSNLPRVIRQLREENENVFEDWLAHVRAALPEIDDIRVVERDDDRHCYLMLRYGTGVENRQIDTLIGPNEGFAPSRQILLMKAVRRLPPLSRSHQQLSMTTAYVPNFGPIFPASRTCWASWFRHVAGSGFSETIRERQIT